MCYRPESGLILKFIKTLTALFISTFVGFSYSGNKIDSLLITLKKCQSDTEKVNLMCKISSTYYFTASDSLSQKKMFDYANEALEISKKINYSKGLANAYYHLANAYYKSNNHAAAFENYHTSLEIAEKYNMPELIANNTNKIGYIHCFIMENFDKALDYFRRSLAIRESMKNKNAIAKTLTNISDAYSKKNMMDSSLHYLLSAYKIAVDIKDSTILLVVTGNIGEEYIRLKQYDKAFKYVSHSKKIAELIKSKLGQAYNGERLGRINYHLGNYEKAEEYSLSAFHYASQVVESTIFLNSLENLSNIYEKTNKKDAAINFKLKFLSAKDSINSREKMLLLTQRENERELRLIELKKEKEIEISKMQNLEEKRRSQLILIAILSVLIISMVFLFIVINRFKLIKKQNAIIKSQKKEVELKSALIEEKQKEIIDSINYAKRIQQALMPSEKIIDKMLNKNNY